MTVLEGRQRRRTDLSAVLTACARASADLTAYAEAARRRIAAIPDDNDEIERGEHE
jgi:hypothetical protein